MTSIVSDFARDAQGWTMQGDYASEGWQKHGGHPGGGLQWVDAAQGDVAYWVASSAYTGDLSGYYGGKLSYSIEDTGSDITGAPDVVIYGANGTTLYAAVGDPGETWTKEQIKLNANAGWHVGSLEGDLATAKQIKAVLADVAGIGIRAEYVNGDESGGLDTVVLASRGDHGAAAAAHDAHPVSLPDSTTHHLGMGWEHIL